MAHAAEQPLSGVLAGWVVVEPDRGATVRLVQLDQASRPVREIAAAKTLADAGVSLDEIGRRAHQIAIEAAARSWRVPASECTASRGQIMHQGGQWAISYMLWVDIA